MSTNDSKKIRLNFIFGLFGQVVTLAIGLILPRLFIMSYGSEVNGFINSVLIHLYTQKAFDIKGFFCRML